MTQARTPSTRLRARHHHTRPRLSPALIAELVHRLTPRDRSVVETVWDHRVLTTGQLAAIYFPNADRAQHRLLELHRMRLLDRFQPWAPVGTRPMHWVLGAAGAYVLAAQRGIDVKELGYRPDKALAISVSAKLGHQVGVNDFFADLHRVARHRADGTSVAEWWHERRCERLWGDLVRPDAFGRWREPAPDGARAEVEFFLEHDTGSESLRHLASKLDGYAGLAESTGKSTPVLFWLPSVRREVNLRRVLATTEVPVATAVQTPASSVEGPAGAVWLPIGSSGPRRRLAEVPAAWGGYAHDPATVGRRDVPEGSEEL